MSLCVLFRMSIYYKQLLYLLHLLLSMRLLGWVPKANIRGYDHKIFIMDFFGSPKLRGSGLNISPKRVLTAFGSPWNTFLGYYIRNADKINIPKVRLMFSLQ